MFLSIYIFTLDTFSIHLFLLNSLSYLILISRYIPEQFKCKIRLLASCSHGIKKDFFVEAPSFPPAGGSTKT